MKSNIFKTLVVLLFALLLICSAKLVIQSFKENWVAALGGIFGFVGMIIMARFEYELVNESNKNTDTGTKDKD